MGKNYGQLKSAVRTLLDAGRSESGFPSGAIELALELAHHDAQARFDFQCMEGAVELLTYSAGNTTGVALPTGFKSVRNLWYYDTTTAAIGNRIEPATDKEVEDIILAQVAQTAGYGTITTDQFHQRHFIKRSRLFLSQPPAADASAIALALDYNKFLSFYTQDADTDDLSEKYWPMLMYGAASMGSQVGWEDARSLEFTQRYEAELSKAIEAELKAKQGPSYTSLRPPIAAGRRY
jgi:hypothetical protein